MYGITLYNAQIQELWGGGKIQSASLGKFFKNSEVFNNLHSWTTDFKFMLKIKNLKKKAIKKYRLHLT